MATSTPPGAGNQTNLGMAPNVAALVCYVPCCIGLIFSIVVAIVEKESKFVRFHAFQSLLFHGAVIVVYIALSVLSMGFAVVHLGILGFLIWLIELLVGVCYLAVSIWLIIKANAGEEYELPTIGRMARNWA